MKIIIIGGVAAGTSAAAKARRNDESAEIKIYDMDSDISYSGCGLPYYIGGEIEDRAELVPRDSEFFKKKYNVDVFKRHEVLDIYPLNKSVVVKNMDTNEEFRESYDKLVIATGAKSIVPSIPGTDKSNIFYLRNVSQADNIKGFIEKQNPKSVVIVGTGFIGLEMAENLKNRGIDVTIVEKANAVMPVLDGDMSVYLEKYLKDKGIKLILGKSVVQLNGKDLIDEVILENGDKINTDFVIMAIGVRPYVELAKKAGIDLGSSGAIKVDTKMRTNIDDIYACGDCAESYSVITKKSFYRPLGSTANKTGRIVGDVITSGSLEFRGILGTGIFKIFDMTVAQSGLTEKEAIKEGYEVVVCHNIKPDKPTYYHGKEMVIKAVADKKDGRLIGVQIIGYTGVDKRIDVFATAMTFGAKAEDLFHLDLAYSPAFSTTKDPVMYTGMILDNALSKGRGIITPAQLKSRIDNGEKITVIDARINKQYEAGHVLDAVNIPQDNIREKLDGLEADNIIVTYCNKGVTGNAVQNILINKGFKKTYNLSGGYTNYISQKNNR